MFVRSLKVLEYNKSNDFANYMQALYISSSKKMPVSHTKCIIVDEEALFEFKLESIIEDDMKDVILKFPENLLYDEDIFPEGERILRQYYIFDKGYLENRIFREVIIEAEKYDDLYLFINNRDDENDEINKPIVDLSPERERDVFTILEYVLDALEGDPNKDKIHDELIEAIQDSQTSYEDTINKMRQYVHFRGL